MDPEAGILFYCWVWIIVARRLWNGHSHETIQKVNGEFFGSDHRVLLKFSMKNNLLDFEVSFSENASEMLM